MPITPEKREGQIPVSVLSEHEQEILRLATMLHFIDEYRKPDVQAELGPYFPAQCEHWYQILLEQDNYLSVEDAIGLKEAIDHISYQLTENHPLMRARERLLREYTEATAGED